jgi:hypothetical protein
MMTRRARKGRDERKTSLYLPRELIRQAKIRAAQDEMPVREVFIHALTAYLGNPRKEGGE